MKMAPGYPQFSSLAVLTNPAYACDDTIYLKGAINLREIEHLPYGKCDRLIFVVYIDHHALYNTYNYNIHAKCVSADFVMKWLAT